MDTGTISPWYCECFDDGVILNHPIRLDVSTMDMEAFLAGFSRCSFDHTRQKYFELQFPAYKKTQHFYKYFDLVVWHCQGFNIFVPPLHTLVQMHDFGHQSYTAQTGLQNKQCSGGDTVLDPPWL
jgi:hypothetical protein